MKHIVKLIVSLCVVCWPMRITHADDEVADLTDAENVPFQWETCGKRSEMDIKVNSPEDARTNTKLRYPWQMVVAIEREKTPDYVCVAALLSHRIALTTVKCESLVDEAAGDSHSVKLISLEAAAKGWWPYLSIKVEKFVRLEVTYLTLVKLEDSYKLTKSKGMIAVNTICVLPPSVISDTLLKWTSDEGVTVEYMEHFDFEWKVSYQQFQLNSQSMELCGERNENTDYVHYCVTSDDLCNRTVMLGSALVTDELDASDRFYLLGLFDAHTTKRDETSCLNVFRFVNTTKFASAIVRAVQSVSNLSPETSESSKDDIYSSDETLLFLIIALVLLFIILVILCVLFSQCKSKKAKKNATYNDSASLVSVNTIRSSLRK